MLSAVGRSLLAKGAGILGAAMMASLVLATAPASPTPPTDPGVCNTTTLSAGGGINGFSLAIARSDGSVWAWGGNAHGQLGNNSTAPSSTPVQVKLTPTQPLTGVISVSGGGQFALALDTNGSVFAWGDNSQGQLGVPGIAESHIATEPLAGAQGPFVAISAGGSHSLALDRNGNLWVWGSNLEGQLGLGPGAASSIASPIKLQSPSGIIGISAGDINSFALDQSGQVWSWGFNGTGQLGNGTQTSNPTPAPAAISAVNAISGGSLFAMARKVDGSLWAWGDDQFGELGNGVFAAPFTPQYFTPAAVPFNFNGGALTMVSTGDGHALALTRNANGSTVWAWGANPYGQLGVADLSNRASPTPLTGMSDVTAVSAGQNHSLALHLNGSASIWGGGIESPQPVGGLPPLLQPVPPCGPSGSGGGPIGTNAPQLSLSVSAPSALSWVASSNYGEAGNYNFNPFPVKVTVQNVGTAPADAVKATISLEPGLTLASGEAATIQLDSLAAAASDQVQWDVRVPFLPVDHTYVYTVTASAANALSVTKNLSIFVPKVPRRIVFVHGIGASFAELVRGGCDYAEAGFLDGLRDKYGDGNVVVFRYYQDAGYQTQSPDCQPHDVTSCQPFPAPDTNVGHLYTTSLRSNSICDSGSDLAYNAAMLDDLLANYPGPQTIIGFSEGGAITRGWLSLILIDRTNSPARKTVDSVIFIQSPQGGSWLALDGPQLAAQNPELIPVGLTFPDLVQQFFGVRDLKRPAVVDVLPESLWYRSVNLGQFVGNLSGIHYYNFYTDIKINANVEFFGHVFGPFPQDLGDGVVRPYDATDSLGRAQGDDPTLYFVSDVGNSRFLPDFTTNRGQFQFSHYGSFSLLMTNPNAPTTVFTTLLQDPYGHAQFLHNFASVVVPSCIRGQGSVVLLAKIEQIVNDPANACNP